MRDRENRLLAVLSWLHAVTFWAGFYIVFPSFIPFLDHGMKGNLFAASLLLIPVVMSYYMLRKIGNVILYLIAAAGISAGMFYITGSLLTLASSIIIFLIRCQSKVEKGRIRRLMKEYPGEQGRFYEPEAWEIPTFLDRPVLIHWGILILEYLLLIFSGEHQYLHGLFAVLFLEIIIRFCYTYIERMKQFIQSRQKIANLPGRMILRNGYIIFIGMTICFLMILLPSVLYRKEPLTALYHERKPISLVIEPDILTPNDTDVDMIRLMEELGIERREPPMWFKVLNQIIIWVTTLIVCIGLLRALLILASGIYRSFAEEEEDEVISLKEAKEEQKRLKKEEKKKQKMYRNSPEYRIRRKYKKRILKTSERRPSGCETPLELENNARINHTQYYTQFHDIYEKARYSQNGCTEDEEKSYPG